MGEGLHLRGVHLAGDVLGLGLFGEDHRAVEVLGHHAGDPDAGGLDGQDLVDLTAGKPPLELLANLSKQLHVHLVVQKLSTFSTSVPFTFPSLRIRSFKSSIGPPPPFLFSYVAARSGSAGKERRGLRSERATVDGDTVLFYKIFSRSAIPFSRSYGNFLPQGAPALFFSCSHAAVPSICKVIHFTGRTGASRSRMCSGWLSLLKTLRSAVSPGRRGCGPPSGPPSWETIRAQAASPVMLMVVRPMSKSRSMPATRAMPLDGDIDAPEAPWSA